MGLLTFSINVTLDGCVDHREGVDGDPLRSDAFEDLWETLHNTQP